MPTSRDDGEDREDTSGRGRSSGFVHDGRQEPDKPVRKGPPPYQNVRPPMLDTSGYSSHQHYTGGPADRGLPPKSPPSRHPHTNYYAPSIPRQVTQSFSFSSQSSRHAPIDHSKSFPPPKGVGTYHNHPPYMQPHPEGGSPANRVMEEDRQPKGGGRRHADHEAGSRGPPVPESPSRYQYQDRDGRNEGSKSPRSHPSCSHPSPSAAGRPVMATPSPKHLSQRKEHFPYHRHHLHTTTCHEFRPLDSPQASQSSPSSHGTPKRAHVEVTRPGRIHYRHDVRDGSYYPGPQSPAAIHPDFIPPKRPRLSEGRHRKKYVTLSPTPAAENRESGRFGNDHRRVNESPHLRSASSNDSGSGGGYDRVASSWSYSSDDSRFYNTQHVRNGPNHKTHYSPWQTTPHHAERYDDRHHYPTHGSSCDGDRTHGSVAVPHDDSRTHGHRGTGRSPSHSYASGTPPRPAPFQSHEGHRPRAEGGSGHYHHHVGHHARHPSDYGPPRPGSEMHHTRPPVLGRDAQQRTPSGSGREQVPMFRWPSSPASQGRDDIEDGGGSSAFTSKHSSLPPPRSPSTNQAPRRHAQTSGSASFDDRYSARHSFSYDDSRRQQASPTIEEMRDIPSERDINRINTSRRTNPYINHNGQASFDRQPHHPEEFSTHMTTGTRKSATEQMQSMSRSRNDRQEIGTEHRLEIEVPRCLPTDNGVPPLLLAQKEDRISLSETLCTIRENIEVFTATSVDVDAPAPGRKRPVVVGQVGLRCVHCRHNTNSSDRVKRAVCFPSSIKRIYRTVIDMKLDHFQHCPFVPRELKARLDELKAVNTRSTGTTMQYFVRAAQKMGMVDGPTGVRFENDGDGKNTPQSPRKTSIGSLDRKHSSSMDETSTSSANATAKDDKSKGDKVARNNEVSSVHESDGVGAESAAKLTRVRTEGERGESVGTSSPSKKSSPGGDNEGADDSSSQKMFTGKVLLSLPEDKTALSPLRCFLRENVYAFSATAEDIAVRTPTTFSVVLGQVGIGCIHCHSLPAKERSNRAVCFPFSIGRIYQSVADIQRFHLGECKMVPESVREKFMSLQSASSKGSKGLATRQYWVTSAKKIGLLDSPNGIRFGRDPSVPAAPAVSLDILAQVASDVTTASKPLVLPEDKPCIAEFLYVVMEQLQPCRFTEADRNKRRLKDVGCIGVECKHCAGQVESRKFFWSSVNAVESNFVSVHTHMMECRMIPTDIKENLAKLKKLRKEQTARLKTGSQKAFFARVWGRLHGDGGKIPATATKPGSDEKQDAIIEKSNIESVSNGIKKMAVVAV